MVDIIQMYEANARIDAETARAISAESALADAVALKASSGSVAALDGRVDTIEAALPGKASSAALSDEASDRAATDNALAANHEALAGVVATKANVTDVADIADDLAFIDNRLNIYQIAYFGEVILDPFASIARYPRMAVMREGDAWIDVDPAEFGLTYFSAPLGGVGANQFHYLDMALLGQTTISPVKSIGSAQAYQPTLLRVPLGTSIGSHLQSFWGGRVRSLTDGLSGHTIVSSSPANDPGAVLYKTIFYDALDRLGGGEAFYVPLDAQFFDADERELLGGAITNSASTELATHCKLPITDSATWILIYRADTAAVAVIPFTDLPALLQAQPGKITILAAKWGSITSSIDIVRTDERVGVNMLAGGLTMVGPDISNAVFDPSTDTGAALAAVAGSALLARGMTQGWKSGVGKRAVVRIDLSDLLISRTVATFRWAAESTGDNVFGSPVVYFNNLDGSVAAFVGVGDGRLVIEQQLSARERIYRLTLDIGNIAPDRVHITHDMTGTGQAVTITGAQYHASRFGAIDVRRDDFAPAPPASGTGLSPHLRNAQAIRAFPRFRDQLLTDAANITQHVAFVGDSYTEYRIWLRNQARAWKAEMGDGGPGWIGIGYPNSDQSAVGGNVDEEQMAVTFTGAGWSGQWMSAEGSPDLCSATTSTAGNKVTLTYDGDRPIATLKLLYLGGSAVSRYRFNAGAWTTLNLSGSGPQTAIIGSVPNTNGWTLEWEHVSGTGVYHGATALTGLAGIVVHDLGIAGSDLHRWAGREAGDPAAWRAASAAAIARLGAVSSFIVPLGTNDQSYDRSYDDYEESMNLWINEVARVAAPGPDILWVSQPENGRDPNSFPPMAGFTERAIKVALEQGIAHLDLQPLFGAAYAEYGYSGTDRVLFDSDALHLNESGGALMRHAIRNALTHRS